MRVRVADRASRLRISARIPSASMADIALLLLIFFMTTTYFQVERGPAMTLPSAVQGEERSREGSAIVHITASGELFWNGVGIDLSTLTQRITVGRETRQVDRVLLYADGTTHFDQIYPVLRGLRSNTPLAVVLAVEPGKANPGMQP